MERGSSTGYEPESSLPGASKKTTGLLKCQQSAEKKGLSVNDATIQACLEKAVAKFDGGTTPAKGCFAKLEAKYPGGCLTTGDSDAAESTIDAFVDTAVSALDPGLSRAGDECVRSGEE